MFLNRYAHPTEGTENLSERARNVVVGGRLACALVLLMGVANSALAMEQSLINEGNPSKQAENAVFDFGIVRAVAALENYIINKANKSSGK